MIVLDEEFTTCRIVKILRGRWSSESPCRFLSPLSDSLAIMALIFPVTELIDGFKENSVSCDDEVVQQVCEEIGPDSLLYQTIDGLIESVGLP